MFGRPSENNVQAPAVRTAAATVAQIQGGGLVQVIVTALDPLTYFLFLNDTAVPQTDVESLCVSIEAEGDTQPIGGSASATLARYVTTVTGERSIQQTELFPCTLEVVALGRRIGVTATKAGSLEGLWIDLGLKPDGTSSEVHGARALNILLTEGILDARLTWTNGETEDLLSRPSSV